MQHVTMSPEMEQCVRECATCHEVCLQTVGHCLRMGGPHAAADHVRLLMDCAQVCDTSRDFMIRGSDLHKLTCGVCAAVCQRCADDCERVGGGGDEQMRRCAEACRRCAASCQRMAGGN